MDEEDSALVSEELMLELEMFVSLEEFTSWLLEDEFWVFCSSDEDDAISSLDELMTVSSEDEETSSVADEELSSPQAANIVTIAQRDTNFFKRMPMFERLYR